VEKMDRQEGKKKVGVNVLITLSQYEALHELVRRRLFRSFSEAIREAVEKLLQEYEGVLKEEVKKE